MVNGTMNTPMIGDGYQRFQPNDIITTHQYNFNEITMDDTQSNLKNKQNPHISVGT